MHKQLVQPNLSPVLKQGNEIIRNWSGWCLLGTQSAFNAGWAGSSAWDAWENRVTYRHGNRDIPAGVSVPIWFDGYDQGQRLGHAAIYKDGKVISTPYFNAANFVTLDSIKEVERIYGMKYVGWSEDIGGVRVIETEVRMNKENAAKSATLLYKLVTGVYPNKEKHEGVTKELMNDPNILDEILEQLAEEGKGFQYKGLHYDEDLANARKGQVADSDGEKFRKLKELLK